MQVYAAIQEESTGRVYVIMSDNQFYYWIRATPGHKMSCPFDSFSGLFSNMAVHEGRNSTHWENVFGLFYPQMRPNAFRPTMLSA